MWYKLRRPVNLQAALIIYFNTIALLKFRQVSILILAMEIIVTY